MVRPRRPRGGARADGLEAAAANELGDLLRVEGIVLVVVVGDRPGTQLLLRPAAGVAPVFPACVVAVVLLLVGLAVLVSLVLGGERLEKIVGGGFELLAGRALQ